ncbi:hypothetical protein MMG00_10765 [Ignatzschineria rhizosphaerae]|uniref:Uncharacterized protein n=1 Tax=Ignatzschineria rhizosphaerae TaxID=2923279 RepID=A0ABY3X073_9GAMM|nr:hypothetical protein [Ignatzschineria rhizosphaerae]UNM95690.1 hypothetical protein MMG00_10765 [Ignatzschineria rhizosphaerae]
MTTRKLTKEQEKRAQRIHQASKRINGKFILSLDQARELVSRNVVDFPQNLPLFGEHRHKASHSSTPEVFAPFPEGTHEHKDLLDDPNLLSKVEFLLETSQHLASLLREKLNEAKHKTMHSYDPIASKDPRLYCKHHHLSRKNPLK